MAGKRHHFVWQMIQRGFTSKYYGQDQFFEFRKGLQPKLTQPRVFGVEKYFYGHEGSLADLNITRIERELSQFILDVRAANDGDSIGSEAISHYITLTELRSKYLRFMLPEVMEEMINSLRPRLNEISIQREILVKAIAKDKIKFPPLKVQQNKDLVLAYLSTCEDEKIRDEFSKLNFNFELFIRMSLEGAKSAQLEVLERDLADFVRARPYHGLLYRVRKFSPDSVLLPDTGLCLIVDGRPTPLNDGKGKTESAIIPISSDTVIIGGKFDFSASLRGINRMLARCSWQSFVAPSDAQSFQALSGLIGEKTKIFEPKMMDALVNEFLLELWD